MPLLSRESVLAYQVELLPAVDSDELAIMSDLG
jgi:hypothetical protein